MSSTYPRNIIGYGQHPPHPQWVNNAWIAVQFVMNYEEGGENCLLHGDEASEAFLSEIVGAVPFKGIRHMNMGKIWSPITLLCCTICAVPAAGQDQFASAVGISGSNVLVLKPGAGQGPATLF